MNTPTDSPRTEDLDKQLLTEKEACAYLRGKRSTEPLYPASLVSL
jgi:hypothetical protein